MNATPTPAAANAPQPAASPFAGFLVGFLVFLALVFIAAIVLAWPMPPGARLMPLFAACTGLGLSLFAIIRLLIGQWREAQQAGEGEASYDIASESEPIDLLRYGGWMLVYIVMLLLLGFIVSTVVFAAAFLRIERKSSWLAIALTCLLTLGLAHLLSAALSVQWPHGLLLAF